MKVTDFVNELMVLYTPEQKSKESIEKMVGIYVEHILRKINDTKKKYNLQKVLTHIQSNYRYRAMPSIPVILEYLTAGEEAPELSLSGIEGKSIRRVVNGCEYEFIVVPNNWGNIPTIADLEREEA